MCGIAGFIDLKKQTSQIILEKMTNTLEHRGPDGFGYKIINNDIAQIGFGHRRLSIIDLSETGKQPMTLNEFTLTFNGEIYNYLEIKSELEALNHKFIGNSDTEMILHAYQEWGKECIHRFIGMFAFVIFDAKTLEFFCARDRAGVKPFFYYLKDGLFLFSSELKAFHQHPRFEKEIDKDSVAAYMQYGSVPTPFCIFKDTLKLKPGHSLTYSLTTQKLTTACYWSVYTTYNKPKLKIDYEEAKKETKRILKSSFEYRMIADVPVGVFLSGGYDSTCVTSILQQNRTKPLKTFTIGVPDIGLNEAPYAKEIANHIGTDHTEINCTEKEAIDLIPELPFFYDEPFADSSALPTTLVARAAKKEVTVALSADGGDEIFAGYNRYDFMMKYGEKLNRIPGFIRSTAVGIMNNVNSESIPILKNKYNFHNRYEKLKGVLKNPTQKDIMLSISQQFTDGQMKNIMATDFNRLPTYFDNDSLKKEFNSPLSYMMAMDYQTYLLDDILQKVDRATMATSLEGREPMLDHRIIEFASQLPDSYKYENGIKKRILRDITHEYVPENLLNRPKMGFAIPIAKWLKNDLQDLVESFINEKNIKEQGLFNWHEIEKIKTAFYNGKKEYDTKIWYILMFQMWYKKWM
jgi:asparagine synthase (glutamine-hydrolysing)